MRAPPKPLGPGISPAEALRERFALPSWLVSAGFHAALLVFLGFSLEGTPRGVALEDTRTVGIVLKQRDAIGESEYVSEEQQSESGELEPAGSTSPGSPHDLFDIAPPSDPTESLPDVSQVIGAGAQGASRIPAAGDLARGAAGGRTITQGRARTSVFGLTGEGYKFVYVFDRSGSMGGSGRTALDGAKAELLKSLQDLSDIHQFEVIFYNHAPTVMELAGPGRLVFATEANKAAARQFVASIPADGTTDHISALLLALRLQPDVIFFLTDADEPRLTRRQLEQIRRLNGQTTTIHAIEFGLGPKLSSENFLTQLARENGGQHVYFDITRLRRRT